ncbi:MAG: alpha/beta hydrolase [Candidatus Lernaella stagnicola]|nr:alpha/beta hydrolase [Candidatus Lernaella stagnicola]
MRRTKRGVVKSFDGTKIRYDSNGDGLPLVLVDGIGCDGYVWKYLHRDFGDNCRTIHMHYRGHGTSDMPADTNFLSIEDLADDIAYILDDDEVEDAILVGHSMGCQVIFEFARRYPDRVLGLAPICGPYGHALKTFHDNRLLETIFPFIYPLFVLTPWVPGAIWRRLVPTELAYQIATNLEINGRMVEYDDFMPYLKFIGQIDLRMFAKMLDHCARHTAEDFLPTITKPVMIIAGENDTFTPMHVQEKMNEMIPGSELLIVPQGSHTAPIEMPQLINLRIERWLLQHFSDRYPEAGVRNNRATA